MRHHPICVEYRMLARSGQYRWFELRGQALWRESGEPYRMAGSILDIQERKQVEERMRRSSLHAVARRDQLKPCPYPRAPAHRGSV